MASIMTSFQLTDRMTAPLMNITNAVSTVINECERAQACQEICLILLN